MNPSITDAFITWAERILRAPDPLFTLKLQRQKFNRETWNSLKTRLLKYSLTRQ